MPRLINLALRGATLVSKFVLIFVLAKLLPLEDVALYGLMVATIAYALMALGMDFYTYATRDLIAAPTRRWAAILRDQSVFYLIAYAVVLPLGLLIFGQGLLPWRMALWFFPLLAAEHAAQELNRLLVAMSQPLWASVVMFLRSGLWALVVVACMWWSPASRNLSFVFGAWLLGATLACLVALWPLRQMDRQSLRNPVNWVWIWRGIKVALPFALATLCLRAMYTADRYLIEWLHSVEVLAAYVLFVGMANAVMSFLDAGVFSFQYPRLLSAASEGKSLAFAQEMKRLWRNTLVATTVLIVAAYGLAFPVLHWLDLPAYTNQVGLLPWTLLAAALTAISMVPHYALYARHRDRTIVMSHVAALPAFALAAWVLWPVLGHATVPAAVATSMAFILVFKLFAYWRCQREAYALSPVN